MPASLHVQWRKQYRRERYMQHLKVPELRQRAADLMINVHGDGKKEDAVFQLNEVQLEAVQKALGGHLRVLEATEADYPCSRAGGSGRRSRTRTRGPAAARWSGSGSTLPRSWPVLPTSRAGRPTGSGDRRWTGPRSYRCRTG